MKQVLKKWNEKKRLFVVILLLMFICMFLFNKLTYYVADDYSYMYSFTEGRERIKNVLDIFPSMYAHALNLNGRLVAHFLVQIFLMFPTIVFDFVNSIMFLFLILILYKYCFWKKQINILALISIFSVVWYFVPAFGQVILWTDGACNYLWSGVIVLWYLYPYVALEKKESVLNNAISKVLYIVAGLFVGNYSETASAGAMFVAILCLFSYRVQRKRKIPSWALWAIFNMGIGYCVMALAPGTLKNKIAVFGIREYFENFLNALDMYVGNLLWLLLVYLVFVIIAIKFEHKNNIVLSLIFLGGGIATNFMHVIAAYYPERSMFISTVFLIVAILLLAKEVQDKFYGIIVTCLSWFIILFAGIQFFHGGYDIYRTYEKCVQRQELIKEAKENGETELALPVISAMTKYSAQYGLIDLDTQIADKWPNEDLAMYYGVRSIIGITE